MYSGICILKDGKVISSSDVNQEIVDLDIGDIGEGEVWVGEISYLNASGSDLFYTSIYSKDYSDVGIAVRFKLKHEIEFLDVLTMDNIPNKYETSVDLQVITQTGTGGIFTFKIATESAMK